MSRRDPYAEYKQKDTPDYSNPASILEALESEAEEASASTVASEAQRAELVAALGRFFAWVVDSKSLSQIGQRAMIAAYIVRPDLINGATLDKIAKARGQGRSATHKLKQEFQAIFDVHCINDKSPTARANMSKAWHAWQDKQRKQKK